MILMAACVLYGGCLYTYFFFMFIMSFFGPLGLIILYVLWAVLFIFPAATFALCGWRLGERFSLTTLGFATLVSIIFFTMAQWIFWDHNYIYRASVRPETYKGIVVTKKSKVLLSLYCYLGMGFEGHLQCLNVQNTAFDI